VVPSNADDLSARMIVELLRSGETVQFRARGLSMWPAITSKSRILVQPCPPSELRVGQIAAFERNGRVVVHRVERVSHAGVHFAGDTLERGDGYIANENVLGRATILERRPLIWQLPRWAHARLIWNVLRRRLTRR
jgi:hypothetical protein